MVRRREICKTFIQTSSNDANSKCPTETHFVPVLLRFYHSVVNSYSVIFPFVTFSIFHVYFDLMLLAIKSEAKAEMLTCFHCIFKSLSCTCIMQLYYMHTFLCTAHRIQKVYFRHIFYSCTRDLYIPYGRPIIFILS